MTISTYSELQTAVGNWLNDSTLTVRVPEFIALTEAEIRRRLAVEPVRPMLTISPVTIDSEFETFPADFVGAESFRVVVNSGSSDIDFTSNQNLIGMKARETQARLELEALLGVTNAPPRYYSLTKDSFWFFPTPTTSWTAYLSYWAELPALSVSNTSNWLLAKHVDVYLFGTLAQAEAFGWNTEGASDWVSAFDAAIARVGASYPEKPDAAPLRMEGTPLYPRTALR